MIERLPRLGVLLAALLLLASGCVDQPMAPRSRAQPPDAPSLLLGVTRTWTGAVSTSWSTGGNWSGGVAPAAGDTVVVPKTVPQYPVLVQNVSIAGVTVQDSALVTLGAFDLTVNGSVDAGITGGITGTTGRLILAGTAATVRGRLPRMQVTGTYSLSGNIAAKSPTEVVLGRLQDSNWRIDSLAF